ncbi:MAG: ABC transporter ATP-binding protein [Acholeplasmataceae bacterium]
MREIEQFERKVSDFTLIKRLLKYLIPHRGKFVVAFILMTITTLANLVMPLAIGFSIDYMSNDSYSFNDKMFILFLGAATILLIMLISVVISYYQSIILQNIGQEVTNTIRKEVYDHIQTLSQGQLNLIPVGRLVTRITNDPDSISNMFTNTIVNLVKNILLIIGIGVILFVIEWKMALIAYLFLPVIFVLSYFFRKYARKTYRVVRNNITSINSYLSENLSGMKITQVFNQEDKKIDEFKEINNKLRKSYLKEINIFGIYRPLVWLVATLATVLTIYIGMQSIFAGLLTIGLFVSFYTYVGQFFQPIQQIAEQFNSLQNGFSSAEKIFEVLDTKPSITDKEDAIELEEFTGEIEFKNVWFQYIPDEWVLKDISFKVNPNETVAFVGATGSGKTTILQLIVRNYEVQKGEILIDGININDIKRSSLRKHVGQMLQDVFLFSGTIKDNITLNDETITDKSISEAVDYIGLDYLLKRLPEGIMHEVKERGGNFSAGERQLISFARAVVYNPSLMILDEATANIDSEAEAIIQESLKKMMNISTMLIVAHRLSTIQDSDKIIVMSKGEIIEEGNHQDLLRNKGHYYHLYQLQYEN